MNYVYLANNRVGAEIIRWLVDQGHPPVGVVVHPADRSKHRAKIMEAAGLTHEHILEAPALHTQTGVEWLELHEPDWLVSVSFGYLLKANVLAIPKHGAVNLHPALLPYNRGAYPNVWSIVEHTPAGVTMHFIDPGVDTGDIISQREVPVLPTDTGATLYARLEEAALELFIETWPRLYLNDLPRRPQPAGGTSHRVADVERIDRIDPNQLIRAGDLIDIIRARTFSPHKGVYLDLGDCRIYLRLELIAEEHG